MSFSFKDQQLKQVGMVALQELATQIIKLIPILGPYIEVGIAIRSKVKEYIDSQDYVRKSELSAIGLLSVNDTQKAVDSVLNLSETKAITGNLSEAQLSFVRNKLLTIPSELDQILKDLWTSEKNNQRAEEADRIEQAASVRQKMLEDNERWLKKMLEKRDYKSALGYAKKMRRIKPFDFSLRRNVYRIYKLSIMQERYKEHRKYSRKWYSYSIFILFFVVIFSVFGHFLSGDIIQWKRGFMMIGLSYPIVFICRLCIRWGYLLFSDLLLIVASLLFLYGCGLLMAVF